ncbi:MAG: FecR family protein [Hyphomicrobiaceae bacterium]
MRSSLIAGLIVVLAAAVVALAPGLASADPLRPAVATIKRIQGPVELLSATAPAVPARVGMTLSPKDRIQTGDKARALLVFVDGSELTIGESAEIVIDEYLYNPKAQRGRSFLAVLKGAFRFTTGKLGGLADRKIEVRTRAANLAVRGTDFWGGVLDGALSVVVFAGRVEVQTRVGSQILDKPRQGTTIALHNSGDPALVGTAASAPTAPAIWQDAKVAQAVDTISFR